MRQNIKWCSLGDDGVVLQKVSFPHIVTLQNKISGALSSACFPWICLLGKAADVGGGAVLSSWKDTAI